MEIVHLLSFFASISFAFGDNAAYFADFEDEAVVKEEWSPQGSDLNMAIVSSEKAASGKQSIAIIDRDPENYAAWQSRKIEIPPSALESGLLSVSWKILYAVPDGKILRFSIFSRGAKRKKP